MLLAGCVPLQVCVVASETRMARLYGTGDHKDEENFILDAFQGMTCYLHSVVRL